MFAYEKIYNETYVTEKNYFFNTNFDTVSPLLKQGNVLFNIIIIWVHCHDRTIVQKSLFKSHIQT